MNIEELIKNLGDKINMQEEKMNKIYISVEKTRKYFLWTMIITLILFVLPLIGLVFAIPSFLSNYTSNIQNLGI